MIHAVFGLQIDIVPIYTTTYYTGEGNVFIWKFDYRFPPARTSKVPKVIKQISRMLVEDVGGIEAAESITRLSKSRIHQCISESDNGSFLPIDVVLELEKYTQSSHFSKLFENKEALATRGVNDNRMVLDFAALSGVFGRIMEEYGLSLEDDDIISPEEAKDLLRHALDLQRSVIAIESKLLSILAGRSN